MGIKPSFKIGDVEKRLNAFLDVVQRRQIQRLQRLGEKCVAYARDAHPNNWEDQTGNLRSSIGYMVFVDGVAIHNSPFDQVSPANPQQNVSYNGGQQGESLCRKIGEQTSGVCLVVVAGMNYAVHVESKGRDVLTGAEHMAERDLPKELDKLINNIKAAI